MAQRAVWFLGSLRSPRNQTALWAIQIPILGPYFLGSLPCPHRRGPYVLITVKSVWFVCLPICSHHFLNNISNSHKSLIFQARRLKFCKVVDLNLLYLYLASIFLSAMTSVSASEVNISSSHNSLIFKLGGWNYNLDSLYLYLTLFFLCQPRHQPPPRISIFQIAITYSFFKLGGRNFAIYIYLT